MRKAEARAALLARRLRQLRERDRLREQQLQQTLALLQEAVQVNQALLPVVRTMRDVARLLCERANLHLPASGTGS